jgi:hypothetical protein
MPYIDMTAHSIHVYTSAHSHALNVLAPLSAERAIEIAAGLIGLARIENGISLTKPKISCIPLLFPPNHVTLKPAKKKK